MIRLTTPMVSAANATDRARLLVGRALGILYPSAVPLRDGRVRLTSRRDTLAAEVMQSLEDYLARRAAQGVADDRLTAEAISILGADVARAREQDPGRGATDAIDRYLSGPGLDPGSRTEAEAMLRVALSSASANDPAAAERLARLSAAGEPPAPSAITTASSDIFREAEYLGSRTPAATSTATTTAGGRRGGRTVGGRHRRVDGRRLRTRQVRAAGLTVAERPGPQVTGTHVLDVLRSINQADIAASVTERPDVQAGLAVLQLRGTEDPQHVQVQLGNVPRGALASTTMSNGTAGNPHVLHIADGLTDAQLRAVWAQQLSQLSQVSAAGDTERPRGILGRLKSLFGHERRDRRLQADEAMFQVMVRDWRDARAEFLTYGQLSGDRSLPELERDLEGLARTIRRHGGAEPALPWAGGPQVDQRAAEFGREAERVQAATTAAPNTQAHLRTQVVTQIETLEAAVKDLGDKAETKRKSSRGATLEAEKAESDAVEEDGQRDLGAPERARKLRAAATGSTAKAARHTQIADGYTDAAGTAQQALDRYRELLTELDDGAPPARVAELAGTAKNHVQAYERSLDRAMPVKNLLMTGVPGEEVELPTGDINRILAARGLGPLPTRGPLPVPAAEYRRLLSGGGMVFAVGNDPDDGSNRLAQVRLRLKPRDLSEVTDRDYELAEQQHGTLGEGGTNVGTTDTHSTSANFGLSLQPILALASVGTPLHAAAQLVSPRIDVSRGRTLANSSGATAHYQSGWVDANSGESLLYQWSGTWEVEVRNSPTEPWSPVETLDAGKQQTWVSSAYTVPAPTETATLDAIGFGAQVTGEFPRHAVTSIDGLQDVTDGLVRKAQQQYGDLDRVAYQQIAGLMINDSYRLLREMSQPGGITRRIQTGGESEYELTWEVEPVWSRAELVGESSTELWQEEVLVDFAGVNASQTFGTSATVSGTVAFPGKADAVNPLGAATVLNNVGGSGVSLSPNVSAGRNVSRSGGQNVSMTAITPGVHRNHGPTQGVLVGMNVRATLRRLDDPKAQPIVETGKCSALLRVAENDLLRVGARADKNAVLLDDNGDVRTDAKGNVLLRGDALPTTQPQQMPPWMGFGPNQLRGIGKALPRKLQGAEELQRKALTQLGKMGLVPLPGAEGTDVQRRNRERIVQQISAPRIEAGINQACQSGLIVSLEDHGSLGTPRWRNFRLSLEQEHDEFGQFKPEGAGATESETNVRLNISSRATGRTSGRSKALPLSAGIGGTHGPAAGMAGLMGRLGLTGNRTARGRNTSQTAGRRAQRVTLNQSTQPVDLVNQKFLMTFAEITDRGDVELAKADGRMEIAYDSAMTRVGTPVYEQNPKAPHDAAVQAAIPVAADPGTADPLPGQTRRRGPAEVICDAISGIRADSTALPALEAALSPDSLCANREWLNGEFRLPFTVVKAPGNPVHMLRDRTILPEEYRIVVRGKAVSLTHVAMSQQNTLDINFTMSDVGATTGTSSAGGFGGTAGGGGVHADGTGRSGGISAGRTGGRAQSTTTSETTGDERLLINPGTHHEFVERYEMTADIVHDGKVIGSIPLPDALAQKAMAERRALELYAGNKLDLPLWVVADAAERYLNDRLPISHRTAAAMLTRYQQEKAGVTTGLAAEHTTERLTAKLVGLSRIPAPQAAGDAEQFEQATQQVVQRADERREVHATEAYDESLGASQIESIMVGDRMLDLRELVQPQIDELAPGLRTASLQLQDDLDVDLDPRGYQGHLEDMLGAGAFEATLEVPIQGQDRPDLLIVRVQAQYVGPRTVDNGPSKPDGSSDLPKEEVGGIVQLYGYETIDRQTGHTVSITGGIDGKGSTALGGDGSGGLTTDRTTTNSAGSSETNVGILREGDFDQKRTQQDILFTTQVFRIRNAGAAAQASARWKLGQIDSADITSVSAPRQVRATMVQYIPQGDLMDGPPPARTPASEQEQALDHRPFQLPEGAFPLRLAVHGRGDARQHELLARLSGELEEELGEEGVAAHRHLLHTSLRPTALKSKTYELLGDGINLRPMTKPGNGRSTVYVSVRARKVGFELHGRAVEGQTGTVWRHEEKYRSSHTSNRLTPLTVSGGLDGALVRAGGSIGEQVKESSTDANGTRLETSRFLDSQLVTVRLPLAFDATIQTATEQGHGEPDVRRSRELPGLASGQMFVRMPQHQFLAILEQLERGVDLDSALADARLQSAPEDFGPPDIVATEYQQGKNGAVYQPYRPLVDLIAQAKAKVQKLVLLMQQADGTEQTYEASDQGVLRGERDGGFGVAFGRLDRRIALMAEGRVDLREVFNSSPPGTFNARVAEALIANGVPRDVLKGLDFGTTAETMAHPATHGTRPHTGATARTIAPTGHGPSLAGP
ncbi:hypothetical protein [Kribbella sp. NPDC004536]|uniref:hypothetical protein n=1 Tax=Kribbella sp. NPDC004536 TaxID=3364106 RepID=UPI0036A191B7